MPLPVSDSIMRCNCFARCDQTISPGECPLYSRL